jgi:hypothetical protein
VTYPGEAMVPKEGASIREKDIMTGRSGAAGSGYDWRIGGPATYSRHATSTLRCPHVAVALAGNIWC